MTLISLIGLESRNFNVQFPLDLLRHPANASCTEAFQRWVSSMTRSRDSLIWNTGKRKSPRRYRVLHSLWISRNGCMRACCRITMNETLPVFVILTREASPAIAEIHDHMPVILPEGIQRVGYLARMQGQSWKWRLTCFNTTKIYDKQNRCRLFCLQQYIPSNFLISKKFTFAKVRRPFLFDLLMIRFQYSKNIMKCMFWNS